MSKVKPDYIRKQHVFSTILALECVVEGVIPFLEDQFQKFHSKLKSQLIHVTQLCTVSCSFKTKDIQQWCYTCSSWRTCILSCHRNGSVIGRHCSDWSNIDSSKWPTHSNEVAKCFYPKWSNAMLGSGPNVDDVAVIVDKMLNCDDIRVEFAQTVDPGQLKNIRNKVHHDKEIPQAAKEQYCQVMMEFLKTPVMWTYQSAQDAYSKIQIFKENDYLDIIRNELIEEDLINRLTTEVDRKEWFRGLKEEHIPSLSIDEKEKTEIRIVSRDNWRAKPPKKIQHLSLPVNIVFVHHTGGLHGDSFKDCAFIVNGIQIQHMDGNGWDDIGYNFLIGEDGIVYEGRGWDKVGAHTFGWNDKSISFAFLGNFNNKKPNTLALNALRNILSFGLQNEKVSQDYVLYGHRDKRPTDGPGHYLYAEIKHFDHFYNKKS